MVPTKPILRPSKSPRSGKRQHQSFFVILRWRGDRDGIQADLMRLTQSGPPSPQFVLDHSDVRHDAQEINVARRAGDSLELSHDKAAAAVQVNVFAKAGVHFREKRSPHLLRLFNAHGRCRLGTRVSTQAGDGIAPRSHLVEKCCIRSTLPCRQAIGAVLRESPSDQFRYFVRWS